MLSRRKLRGNSTPRGSLEPSTPCKLRKRIGDAVHRWKAIIEAMSHPAFELDSEEFAQVLRTAAEMESLGLTLDPGLRALMLVLARQMIGTEADADFDLWDRWIEKNDDEVHDDGDAPVHYKLQSLPLEKGFAAGHVGAFGDSLRQFEQKPEYRDSREFKLGGPEPAWKGATRIAEDPNDDPDLDTSDERAV